MTPGHFAHVKERDASGKVCFYVFNRTPCPTKVSVASPVLCVSPQYVFCTVYYLDASSHCQTLRSPERCAAFSFCSPVQPVGSNSDPGPLAANDCSEVTVHSINKPPKSVLETPRQQHVLVPPSCRAPCACQMSVVSLTPRPCPVGPQIPQEKSVAPFLLQGGV